jgi:hypothetical protein
LGFLAFLGGAKSFGVLTSDPKAFRAIPAQLVMTMVGQPARVRQRDIQTIIRGAQKEGAKRIEIRIGTDASVIIPLCEDEQKPVAKEEQISL